MITKTQYVMYRGCPRMFYYSLKNKDQAKPTDEIAQKRIDEGMLVNEYAHKYFPNTAKVKANLKVVDIDKQVEITKKLLETNTQSIAEASFIFNGLFCAVDILVKNGDGYDIYEVKGATELKKEYYPDLAFQKYVLEMCGIKVNNCYILHLNIDYIRHGDINVQELLKPVCLNNNEDEKITALFNSECEMVQVNTAAMRDMEQNPNLPSYGCCGRDCDFFEFCHRDLPKPNITDLNGIRMDKAHKYIHDGIKTFEDAQKQSIKLNQYQAIQLKTTLEGQNATFINKDLVARFLKSLRYPIYHLDFETINEAIPPFDGVGCYQQIPFQYSLHIEHSPNGQLEHKEFLGRAFDCEYELAKQLCNDIPLNATTMAYNMRFEKMVLKHLAERFKDLSDHLMNIHDNMIDLIVPFKKAYFYSAKQGRSNSIKYVMPALCPSMEDEYHKLPLVHNGGEALAMFPRLLKLSGPELEKKRDGMLKYCCLDTLSMVKVLNALWDKIS